MSHYDLKKGIEAANIDAPASHSPFGVKSLVQCVADALAKRGALHAEGEKKEQEALASRRSYLHQQAKRLLGR